MATKQEQYQVRDVVNVERCKLPNINIEGGVARIKKVNSAGTANVTYDVSYITCPKVEKGLLPSQLTRYIMDKEAPKRVSDTEIFHL